MEVALLIDVEKLYIVNYCHSSCIPFKNIMRLPKKEAYKIVDKILYKKFIELGGKPQNEHPLSFVFQGSKYLHDWFDNGTINIVH